MKTRQKGFTLVEILIVIGIIGLILSLLVISLNSKQQQIRDSKRISDMQTLRSALEVVKNETGGYDQAYCDLTFVSLCAKKENSMLFKVMPGLVKTNDPKVLDVKCSNADACANKGCNYSITRLEPTDYEILFHLEKGVDEFNLEGCYKVTPAGIIKM